jgi:NitT/TauT family transport system ATP-binding protein
MTERSEGMPPERPPGRRAEIGPGGAALGERMSDGAGGAAAVQVRGVSMVFNAERPNRVDALVDIDLAVHTGEFVALIGPSGCGKSTLLRLIADLLQPTSGTVTVNGKRAEQARVDQDYGMAFQQSGLFDWRNVERNIELPLELKGWDKARRRARSAEMLALVKLDEFARHMPWQLSGGMQQRVAIARALAARPALLLMDEPFGALDEMTREHMQTELLRICAETGTTVVFVTHSIPEAVYLADRVVVMSPRPGRITGMVDVGLGRDRGVETREATEFFARVTEVRELLRGIELTDASLAPAVDPVRGVDDR